MPVEFANEYVKYQNKIGGNIFTSFLSSSTFQDVIKPSISPVVELVSNVKEIKDNATDKYESKTSTDINTFNNFNKVKNIKPSVSQPKSIPIFNNPNIPAKDLAVFKKIIEET